MEVLVTLVLISGFLAAIAILIGAILAEIAWHIFKQYFSTTPKPPIYYDILDL